ncbi:YjiH family protein [Metabacillus iocasae]|uniref:Nucleoside recognition membrane protein YjiH n=1 Tax=Priestia iocasae TaxID=2291674 RepID=A0ABS2QTE6_9BACI|nr:YjiH family protein [Metabacillus iocasae]MBM7702468.1 nucleoside recognition membrane protein YjiH [Metabacillus iocasae]
MALKKEEVYSQQLGKVSASQYAKFIVPSLLGIILFLIPVKVDGKVTIVLGVMADTLMAAIGSYIPAMMVGVLAIAAIGSLFAKIAQPSFINNRPMLKSLFQVEWLWVFLRVVGAVFAALTLFEMGPEAISSKFTGGTVLFDLIPVLTLWFFFAALCMPLLLEYGLMDFIGTLVRKIMYPLFKLPGRSSIDALASWMGSGTVGVLITTKQYEEGYYTQREAAVIATNFSVASIAFSLVIAKFIGIDHMFVPFYFTVVVAGVLTAIICPRIPPLSRKTDDYYGPVGKQIDEAVPQGVSSFQWGMQQAVEKASKADGPKIVVKKAIHNVLDIWLGLIPLVMALGTMALIVAEYTSVFTYLSYPFVPLLSLLQIPEAAEAAPAMIVGFADMFLPAVIGSGIESELTRFVIACMSLTQIIYMSEIGILLLKSKIPVSFLELFVIFLQRTLISLPIIALLAHVLI